MLMLTFSGSIRCLERSHEFLNLRTDFADFLLYPYYMIIVRFLQQECHSYVNGRANRDAYLGTLYLKEGSKQSPGKRFDTLHLPYGDREFFL